MSHTPLKKLVAFALLMEGEDGVLEKVPDYILEKWNEIQLLPDHELPKILDQSRRARFQQYFKMWRV